MAEGDPKAVATVSAVARNIFAKNAPPQGDCLG
jgi:hypothetical protein